MSMLLDRPAPAAPEEPDATTRDFYLRALALLDQANVPYLVGGGYAMAQYTGIVRHTKDLDLFCRPRHRDRLLEVLADGGYKTDLCWPHFLAKVLHADAFIDVIYRSGNGLCEVDDAWFQHAAHGEVLGYPVMLCPIEETLWSKSFVMERDRFDGADVNHLLLHHGDHLDWPRLLRRFGGAERVLLAHLILYGFVYPGEQGRVPEHVLDDLAARVRDERVTDPRLCRGTLLSKFMYLSDVERGYQDVRLPPRGTMTPADVTHFTAV
jgi:aminoglycoside-2''-adenylyltransferase